MVEVRETHESREKQLLELTARVWPELELLSMEADFPCHVNGRYQPTVHGFVFALAGRQTGKRRVLGWCASLFTTPPKVLEIVRWSEVTDYKGLHFQQGWDDIALYLYDRSQLERTRALAASIEKLTGKTANIVLQS